MELKLNIKAKHESRTRLNQLGRLAHNRYASFAHFIREKIRNFFSYFYPKTACHSKIFENSRFVKEMVEHSKIVRVSPWNDSDIRLWEERMNEMNEMTEESVEGDIYKCISSDRMVLGKCVDGGLFQFKGRRQNDEITTFKIEDFTKSLLELSDGNIIVIIPLKVKISSEFPTWQWEVEDNCFFVRKFSEKIHSENDICLIDVFENIQNLEINHFFLCNYINNPSLYNAYLANELDERKYNNDRIVWSGCLERWKNRL